MSSVNQFGQEIESILTKSKDQAVKTGIEYAESIRTSAEAAGKHEERERIIALLEGFPQWALSPNLGQDDKKEQDRAKYEQMVTFKRIYDHARTKKMSYTEFKNICQRNSIPDDHVLLMFAAVKFNSERLNAMINDNQGILL